MNDLFYNLIENGIKYNKPNGKLWVTVSEKTSVYREGYRDRCADEISEPDF